MSSTRTYTTLQFARLAGVTVRALHHYDRLGLLVPARTSARYRRYSDADLETLEQIVVLKFIGISLKHIAQIRRQAPGKLAESLKAQRGTLERKRHMLDAAIASITTLERAVGDGAPIDPALFTRVIEVIDMQSRPEDWKKAYDELVAQKISRLQAISPEARAALRSDWNDLVTEIRALALEEAEGKTSPAAVFEAKAQALAVRWEQLLEALMGRPVTSGDLATHQNHQEWTPQMATFVDKPVWDFMREVFRRRAATAS